MYDYFISRIVPTLEWTVTESEDEKKTRFQSAFHLTFIKSRYDNLLAGKRQRWSKFL